MRVGGGMYDASLLPAASPLVRRHEESDLQRSVHQFLERALPADALHFAIPNGLMRSKKARARAVGEGVRAGICDICVLHRGHAYMIELKSRRGVLSAAQKAMMQKLIYCGVDVCVCRSVPEVEAALRECGVHLRAKVAA
jgi:hypothetical protein